MERGEAAKQELKRGGAVVCVRGGGWGGTMWVGFSSVVGI